MIAREGLVFIVSGGLLSIILIFAAARLDNIWFFSGAVLFAILTVFCTYFFRDPERTITEKPLALVSPADGKVIGIDTLATHNFTGFETIKISIFLSVFDVHVNRVPAEGVIDFVNYNPGEFFAAFEDKASDRNEQTEIGMTTDSGHKIIFKQIAGLIARRIVCKLEKGDTVKRGQRFGLIRFGSRTELFLPAGTDIRIKVGDKVDGGSSLIGFLPTKLETEGN